ncbi:MAG: hypothetical protein C6Y22_22480 [Hapalosiphonaceae cyanobacterium JJU2]|nr:MAG: hypothetical protein C6Y22_22480 [Hapalosiphonaceae cyanobacterium JJU2]
MSKITISDINVEMIEVSEVDSAAIVGGSVLDFLGGLAVLGEGFATKKLEAFVGLTKYGVDAVAGL